ncbi:MAG: hypothetical protein KDC69_05930 [Flavobacteriaceae bacterium]|nr:hypothetical protein [Flavobacteriaceae bacterium]
MKNTSIPILPLIIVVFMISCGESKQKNKENINKEAVSSKTIDACQWLSKNEVETLLETKVGECKVLINQADASGKNVVSQVAYYSESTPDKHVGLMIKKTSVDTTPGSKEDFANQNKTEDVMGSGDEMYNAIMNGEEISGLGNKAFTYEMFGHNLMVFSKGHYQIIITVFGQESDKNIEFQKKLAAEIINGI